MAQPAPLSTGETLAAVYDRLAALAPAHGRPPPDAEARDAAAKRPADGPAPEHPPKRPKTEENSSSGGSDDASRGGASSGDDTSGATADGLSLTSPLAPVVRMRTLAAASGETLQRLPAGRAGRMLVADDSYTVRRYLQRTFERKGYVVDVAQNGWQAFAQMQTRLYDFVFLDIEMPVMNGYRCAQAIRRWEARVEREQKQFICALTSHAQPDERELGLGIGMDLFEAKPAKPKRLLGIVEQALAAANGDAATAAAIAAAATAKACAEAGAAVLADEAPPAPLGDLTVGEEVELCLCARSGLAWIGAAVTRVRAPGPTYDVAGDVVTASNVARRRLRKPNQTQAPLAPGVPVDVAHEGALRPGEVVAVDGGAGTCDVKLADGTPLQGVAAAKVLALHA